jgi:uncharacterized linocin/CFP29 family protein
VGVVICRSLANYVVVLNIYIYIYLNTQAKSNYNVTEIFAEIAQKLPKTSPVVPESVIVTPAGGGNQDGCGC